MTGGEVEIQYGLSLPNRAVVFGVPVEEILTVANAAEQDEFFESVWVGDNLFSRPRMEAIVLLSAIAAQTCRVKLGTVCMASFPMRHPLLFGLQWASLDRLSNGRSILAVCLGDSALAGESFARELAAMGIESRDRVGRLEEGVQILRQAWSEGPVSHHGRFYDFDKIDVLPRPKSERPPILIASNPKVDGDPKVEERSLRRVARIGDGWQTYGHSPELLGDRWRRIRDYAKEYDRQDSVKDCSMHLMVNVGRSKDDCRSEAIEFFDRYYGDEGIMHSTDLDAQGAFGSPEDVIKHITSYRRSGVTRLILRFASLSQLGQMNLFSEHVAPALTSDSSA